MSTFKSNSQAGQDAYAHHLIGDVGTFLDIGAHHPTYISNTYALERLVWSGILVENDPVMVEKLKRERSVLVLDADATTIDWSQYLQLAPVDYLSLDVDEASLAALKNLLTNGPRFRCMTVEHDEYRFGEAVRQEMMAMLLAAKYDILCSQVMLKGSSFEIWAVDPLLVDMARAEKFRRNEPTEWEDFFK